MGPISMLNEIVKELEKGPTLVERMGELISLLEKLQPLEAVQKKDFEGFICLSNEIMIRLQCQGGEAVQKALDTQQQCFDIAAEYRGMIKELVEANGSLAKQNDELARLAIEQQIPELHPFAKGARA